MFIFLNKIPNHFLKFLNIFELMDVKSFLKDNSIYHIHSQYYLRLPPIIVNYYHRY